MPRLKAFGAVFALSLLSSSAALAYGPDGFTLLPFAHLGTDGSLGVTASKAWTVSFWLKGTLLRDNAWSSVQNTTLYSTWNTWCEPNDTSPYAPGWCWAVDEDDGTYQFNFNNSSGHAGEGVHFLLKHPSSVGWHHYIISFDTHTGLSAAYVDGQYKGTADALPADLVPAIDAGGFHIGPQGAALQYQAEMVIAGTPVVCASAGVTTMLGLTVNCSGANTIPPEIISRFLNNGNPVNLGLNCKTAFNNAFSPEICIRDGLTSNSGTGSALVGQAWNHDGVAASYTTIQKAPYGPNGIVAHRATLKWTQHAQPFYGATIVNGNPKDTMTTDAAGNQISSGDLLILASSIVSSTSSADAHMACPTGFTTLGPVVDPNDNNNSVVCYKFAGSGETGAYDFTFDHGFASRTYDWAMYDYANAASVDQTGSNYNSTPTSTHKTAAGLSTTSSNETVLSLIINYNAGDNVPWIAGSGGGGGGSSSQRIEWRQPDVGTPSLFIMTDEYGIASGANPQRTFQSNGNDTSAGYTITIVPN